MKNILNGIDSRLSIKYEKIIDCENIAIETIQNKTQGEKKPD